MSKLDQIGDANGVKFAAMLQEFQPPDFVKQADITETFGAPSEPLPPNCFADTAGKQFPCHTKTATWVSALYFYNNESSVPVEDRPRIHRAIEKFASFWHVLPQVNEIKHKAQGMNKVAEEQAPDGVFLAVIDFEGDKKRYCPLRTPHEVKEAAQWLRNYENEFELGDRIKMANKLIEAADNLGAALPDRPYYEKQAGHAITNMTTIKKAFEQRLEHCKTAEQKTQWKAVIDSLKDLNDQALEPATTIKLATLLDVTDRNLQITNLYGDYLTKPEDAIFAIPFTKVAEIADESVTLATQNVYKKEDLAKIAADSMLALFGQDFVDQVTDGLFVDSEKAAEHFAALPLPDAELLDKLAAESGIKPVATKRVSRVEKIAQFYRQSKK